MITSITLKPLYDREAPMVNCFGIMEFLWHQSRKKSIPESSIKWVTMHWMLKLSSMGILLFKSLFSDFIFLQFSLRLFVLIILFGSYPMKPLQMNVIKIYGVQTAVSKVLVNKNSISTFTYNSTTKVLSSPCSEKKSSLSNVRFFVRFWQCGL
jgi:hypothetical protein